MKILIEVKGNINNYIYYMHKKGVPLLKIKYIDKNKTNILIYDKDIDNANISGYEIKILKDYGIKGIINVLKINKYMIISLIIGMIIFYILSNIIYDIDISYSENDMRNLIMSELNNYGIKKYSFAKNYDELSMIKDEILSRNKDSLEWLMIERVGVKYIVRLEPRKINIIKDDDAIYDVVAKKDAFIKKIISSKGEVVKEINTFVKKGEVIVSSDIYLNGNLKSQVSAEAKVYGETWYKVRIKYPLNYYEEKETGKVKKIYNLKIFDRYIGLKGFKNKKVYDKYILKDYLLPIGLNKQMQKEIIIINDVLDIDEASLKALEYANKKMVERLNTDEYIIEEKKLNLETKDSKIILDVFYKVYEDITLYKEKEVLNDIQQ